MTFARESKWSEIKQLVDGETKLDASTLNDELLRLVISRTDYLREHLESLMEFLKVLYDPNDARPEEEKQADPRFAATLLQLLADSRVEGRVTPPGTALTELPSDSMLTTDNAGRATWRAIADVVAGGTTAPTPETSGIKSVVVLEERKLRSVGASSDITPALDQTIFYPSAWNYVQTWGEEIITKFYTLDEFSQVSEIPPTNGQWDGIYPLFMTLKKGNYMVDGVINLLYAGNGQCRLAKGKTGNVPGTTTENDDQRHASAIYGSSAIATRLGMPVVLESDIARGFNAVDEVQRPWSDANNSASSFHAMITEGFFEGMDEINIAFELCTAKGNDVGLRNSNPGLAQLVWGLGINRADAPPESMNIFKRLRIVKVG